MEHLRYVCQGAGTALRPYLLSTLDAVAWRYGMPESLYPEALTPGMREVGSRASGNLWGNVYPRSGFLHQTDDYKAAAVVAQRAGDVITRRGQPHVYQPLVANSRSGYWPAGALMAVPASGNRCRPWLPTNARSSDYAYQCWSWRSRRQRIPPCGLQPSQYGRPATRRTAPGTADVPATP